MKEVGRRMIFPQFLRNLHDVLRNVGAMLQSPKEKKEKKKKTKNKNDTIFLTSTIVYWLLRDPYFEIFGDEKYCFFLSQKVEI